MPGKNGATTRFHVINSDRDTVLGERVVRAGNLLTRTRGLMGVASLPVGAGLLLDGDNAIHTCFMRFPIDVVFVDNQERVLHLIHRLAPWRASRFVWRARAVLELPAGTLDRTRTQVGDRLAFGTQA